MELGSKITLAHSLKRIFSSQTSLHWVERKGFIGISKPLNTYPYSMNYISRLPALSLAFTYHSLLPISNHPNPAIIVELKLEKTNLHHPI